MKNKLWTITKLTLVIAFILFMYWITTKDVHELKKHHGFAVGKVLRISGTYKGVQQYIDYSYSINHKEYTHSTRLDGFDKSADILVGKYFIVVYSTSNPENCDILIQRYDYTKYDATCPDSLKWAADSCSNF